MPPLKWQRCSRYFDVGGKAIHPGFSCRNLAACFVELVLTCDTFARKLLNPVERLHCKHPFGHCAFVVRLFLFQTGLKVIRFKPDQVVTGLYGLSFPNV
ncbi:hypothetical protein RvVAR0630_pl05020 (plasmid) [Agrobacterium vitis]|nr:hypothetical protein RvVAR0630_pl05020 [Agrobacterium vitis]